MIHREHSFEWEDSLKPVFLDVSVNQANQYTTSASARQTNIRPFKNSILIMRTMTS